MSGAFLLATDKRSAEPKCEFFGLELSRAYKALDRLAKELDVPSLTAFISLDETDQTELAALIEEAGGDISDFKIEPVRWFEASEGLKTVRALLKRLIADPKAVRKVSDIVAELKELKAALTVIGRKKARWRFWIDT